MIDNPLESREMAAEITQLRKNINGEPAINIRRLMNWITGNDDYITPVEKFNKLANSRRKTGVQNYKV